MPDTQSNITVGQCAKAAEWWAQFLPVVSEAQPEEPKSAGYLALEEPQGRRQRQYERTLGARRNSLPPVSAEARDQFVSELTALIHHSAKAQAIAPRLPDRFVKIGATSDYQPPDEVQTALKNAGLAGYDVMMPGKVEVRLQPNGVIDVDKYGKHEYLYHGEGDAPATLGQFDIDAQRLASAPLVTARSSAYLYHPVKKGETYITRFTSFLKDRNPEEDTEIAQTDGFVFSCQNTKGNQTDLINKRDAFDHIDFCGPHRNYSLYPELSAPAGTPIERDISGNPHFPVSELWMHNDGEGHCVGWTPPLQLVRLERGERVLGRGVSGGTVGGAGDFILVNPETQQKTLLTKEVIQQYGYEIHRCDEQGQLKTPNRPIVDSSARMQGL